MNNNQNIKTNDLPIVTLRNNKKIKGLRQSEISECGLMCLGMVAGYWGKDLNITELRRRFTVTSRGMGLADVMKCASSLQMTPRPLKIDIDGLHKLNLPAILHWDMNHFVVLEKIKKNKFYIVDPLFGFGSWHDEKYLDKHFTGIALELTPATDFTQEKINTKQKITDLWGNVDGLGSTIFQAVMLSLILQIFVLMSPYLIQISIDEAIPSADTDLITVMGLGFTALALITGIAFAMRSYVLLSAGTLLSYAISTNVARHMLRLPVSWYEKRSIGDILSRFQSIQPLRKIMTEGMAAAFLDGIMAIITLTAMLIYSPLLTAIPIAGLILYIGLRVLTLNNEKISEGESITAMGKEQGSMIETLRGIITIRLSGREVIRQATWQNKLSDYLSYKYQNDKIDATQKAGNHLIEALESVIIIWIGVLMVIKGGFSIGMLLAFAAWRFQFSNAARRVVDQAAAWRVAILHLERLADITMEKEDIGFKEPETTAEPLKGKIELKNISHKYGEHESLVLENINLTIEAGENVVITGPSGGGKSTLIKIILGLIEPTSGQMFIDDEPLEKYGRRAYRAQIGAVLQEDALFNGSISDNITGFIDPDPDHLINSMQKASIYDDIMNMPMKEKTMVGDMGSTLSGGQKQRILIARAIYSKPRMLVLDEGTSALDALHEKNVSKNIADLGITRIGIAHREETIKMAKRVITLKSGKIVLND